MGLILLTVIASIVIGGLFGLLMTWANTNSAKQRLEIEKHRADATYRKVYDLDEHPDERQWNAWTQPINSNKDSHSAFDEKP